MEIKRLELFSRDINAQKEFYTKILELPLIEEYSKSFTVKIGHSELQLSMNKNATPYHFAINIPTNKVLEAVAWLEERVVLLKDGDDKIIDFRAWNAEALYFFDKDENIVEFISRHRLENQIESHFSSKALLEISEIGMPLKDIESGYKQLNEKVALPIFDGSFDRFCAIGDENGLFISINPEKKKDWYPTNKTPEQSSFNITFKQGTDLYAMSFNEGEIEIKKSSNI
ncbi:VOC family protein [Flammeovirga sp. SubArs3]|uniref:VOC family protein n=1 Tax=Flammeovirga sp. SubArs3 TaxID=2995316 RepID=UPI00248BE8D3|nr:VOC family protein [Flammeovirga sp. SubArs3]